MEFSEERVLNPGVRSLLQIDIEKRGLDVVARDLKINNNVLKEMRDIGVVGRSAAERIASFQGIPYNKVYTIQKMDSELFVKRISKQVGTEIPPEVVLDLELRVTRIALHLNASLPKLFMSQKGLDQVIDHKTYRQILKIGKSKKETLQRLKDRVEYLEKFLGLPPIGTELP